MPSRDYFLKEDSNAIINEYKTFIQTIVKELGSSHDGIIDEVNNLVVFETTIAQVKTGMIKVGIMDSDYRGRAESVYQQGCPSCSRQHF